MSRTLIDASLIAPFANTFIGMGRNRIINGEMLIDQANGLTDAVVNSATPVYSADMFRGIGMPAAGVFTMAVDLPASMPSGFKQALRVTCNTVDSSIVAADSYTIQTHLEGYTIRDFLFGTANAKTLTLTFWVRSSLTGTYTGAIKCFQTALSYPFEYTVSAADTWEKKTVVVPGATTGSWPVNANRQMDIVWGLALGSSLVGTANTWNSADVYGTGNQVNFMASNTSRTWYLTGVQLEIGAIATDFERRPYLSELALCQRYFFKNANQIGGHTYESGYYVSADGNTYMRVLGMLPEAMRASPTLTQAPIVQPEMSSAGTTSADTGWANVSCASIDAANRHVIMSARKAGNQMAGGRGWNWYSGFTADARL